MIELARAENRAMHKSWQAVGAQPVRVRVRPQRKKASDQQYRDQAMETARQFASSRGVDLSQLLSSAGASGRRPCSITPIRRECWKVLAEDGVPHRIIAQVFGNRSATTISSGISLYTKRKKAGGKQQ
ncbi:hypothetical protein VWZ40_00780 [Phaeobacter sp. JH20_21]